MTINTILRVRPDTGEIFILARNPNGYFELGDPAFANEKHHAKRRVTVSTADEVLEHVARGFSVRLRGLGSSQFNMICPGELKIVAVPT